jgi:hypothetical protein
MSLEAYFASRTPAQRRVFDAVAGQLAELDGVEVEAVSVGILIKRSRTFAELRPRRDGFALSLLMPRRLDHPRIRQTLAGGSSRVSHVITLRDAADVDDELRTWLTESYLNAGE